MMKTFETSRVRAGTPKWLFERPVLRAPPLQPRRGPAEPSPLARASIPLPKNDCNVRVGRSFCALCRNAMFFLTRQEHAVRCAVRRVAPPPVGCIVVAEPTFLD